VPLVNAAVDASVNVEAAVFANAVADVKLN